MSNNSTQNSVPEEEANTVPVQVNNEESSEEFQETRKITRENIETRDAAVTQAVHVITEETEDKKKSKEKKKNEKKDRRDNPRRWLWILFGLLLVILITAGGAYLGYKDGIGVRLSAEDGMVTHQAVTQFQLAQEDQGAGRLEMARQRYEYVIRIDPGFPGAAEKLTEVMLNMAETAVPTVAPTPTPIPLTPTPDLRGVEEKFAMADMLLRSRDWNGAISGIEILREEDLLYRAVDVDGLYYIALRFRGIEKITNGNLEGGIYDLTLAQGFGPLDKEAEGYRNWARYYLTGSSFWELDWYQVVQIFGEIYPSLPNLHDGSGWTAQERYRVGCIRLAEQLAQEERWCDSRYYYQLALGLGNDPNITANATKVAYICEPPTPTPTMTPVVTETPVPTPTTEGGGEEGGTEEGGE